MSEKDIEFMNPHAGIHGRDGGPYLDDVERFKAETNRAAKEDREPDYDAATFTAGTPATTRRVLEQVPLEVANVSLAANADLPDKVDAHETLPVDVTSPEEYAAEGNDPYVEPEAEKSPAPAVNKVENKPAVTSEKK